MNKQRRKELEKIADRLSGIGFMLSQLQEDFQSIIDDERDAVENIPENMTGKKEKADWDLRTLENACDDLDVWRFGEICDELMEMIEG